MKVYPIDILPCPFCGNSDELTLKVQTPVCNDGRHRDAYIRCFQCGVRGPYINIDMSTQEVGKMSVLPVLEKWNTRTNQDAELASSPLSEKYAEVVRLSTELREAMKATEASSGLSEWSLLDRENCLFEEWKTAVDALQEVEK